MRRFYANTLFKVGLWMLILGSGPLLLIIAAAELGLLSDPNPNPIGPGLLMFFTFWPAMICLGLGAVQVMRGVQPVPPSDTTPHWTGSRNVRILAGVIGGYLLLRGITTALLYGLQERSTVATALLGVVGIWWASTGRLPGWWGRHR
jgi:hypothetical protein